MANKKIKKDSKNSSLNIKITVITSIIVVWIICFALIMSQCESKQNTENVVGTTEDVVSSVNSYESNEIGKISKEESKSVAYFNTHYKGDYYFVTEYKISSEEKGTYYQTETVAWSSQGYKYKKIDMCSYEDMEFYNDGMEYLITPTNSYVMYPSTKTYFKSDNNTEGYQTEVTFDNEEFVTGTINVDGKDYYYEEITDENGINSKYCFDKNDDIRYLITTANGASVTATYMEYSENVDYSLFEVPADYVLGR